VLKLNLSMCTQKIVTMCTPKIVKTYTPKSKFIRSAYIPPRK